MVLRSLKVFMIRASIFVSVVFLTSINPDNCKAELVTVGKLNDAISPQLDGDRCNYSLRVANFDGTTESLSFTLPADRISTFQSKEGTLVEQIIVSVSPEIVGSLFESGYIEFFDKKFLDYYLQFKSNIISGGKYINSSQKVIQLPPLAIIADIVAKPTLIGKTVQPEEPIKGIYAINQSSLAIGIARIVTPEFFTIQKLCQPERVDQSRKM